MYINPKWRILTVGDGDLSFSSSLWHHHKPQSLTATIFDDLTTLTDKYGGQFYQQLNQAGCKVLTDFDVTNPQTWSTLAPQQFDLVIFQFPLVPGFSDRNDFSQQCQHVGVNTLNRRLLRTFLLNSINHFLDPAGPQLCLITSKDVKPYREWDIEHSLIQNTAINYLGNMAFNSADFPDYRIRNVDRDKFVKNTLGISYVWSARQHCEFDDLLTPAKFQTSQANGNSEYCAMCRVGPFGNEQDKRIHQQSKRHLKMANFEQQWQTELIRNV